MKVAAALLAMLLTPPALAAPGGRDVERAATRTAQTLDGVLRGCPASFARVGTTDKKCVGVTGTVEEARTRLGAVLEGDLYGVWRSRDEQRSVYNWLRTPGGYIYLRLQPDPEGRAQTLVYLDLPPESAAQGSGSNRTGTAPATTPSARPATNAPATRPVTPRPVAPRPATPPRGTPAPAQSTAQTHAQTNAQSTASTAQPSARPTTQPTTQPTAQTTPQTTRPATTPTPPAPAAGTLARVPFTRSLGLQDQRLNGEDVRAVQDRLITLTRPSGGGRGDGWYGPVTAATVRAFQVVNGLPVTGRVDRATWELLFSERARPFPASGIR